LGAPGRGTKANPGERIPDIRGPTLVVRKIPHPETRTTDELSGFAEKRSVRVESTHVLRAGGDTKSKS